MPADFGELRSLMNSEGLDDQQRQKLWVLLKSAFIEDEERYSSEWRPYLEGFAHHFETPLATIEQPTALLRAVTIAPFANFRLVYRGSARDLLPALRAPESSNSFSRVTELTINASQFLGRDFRELFTSSALDRVTRLKSSSNALGQEGIDALCNSSMLENLEVLQLWDAGIEGMMVCDLLASPKLGKLAHLNLNANPMDEQGCRELARNPAASSLRTLELAWNALPDAALVALTEQGNTLTALETLDLAGCNIGPAGVAALAESALLSQLRSLRLLYNRIEDEGAILLANSPHTSNLEEFDLSGTNVSRRGIEALGSSPHLKPEIRRQFEGKAYI